MAKKPREMSLTCWPGGDSTQKCETFSITLHKGERQYGKNGASNRLHLEAGRAGWVIGHVEGQAYYCCGDHAETLYDPIRLNVGDRTAIAPAT